MLRRPPVIAPSPSDAPPAALEPAELALWMGQLLMEQGAESERVEQAVRVCGESLGFRWSAVLVTYDALFLTRRGPQDSGLLRRASPRAVNMNLIEELSHLGHRMRDGRFSPEEVQEALLRIESAPRRYSAHVTGLAIALACAAFSRLFQGDWGAFAITFVGSGAAMLVRHYYAPHKPNRLIFAGASALVAAFTVGILQRIWDLSQTPAAAYAACALMVVPGVPAINAVQDLIRGHLGVGLARAIEVGLIIVAGTLGILLGYGLAWGWL